MAENKYDAGRISDLIMQIAQAEKEWAAAKKTSEEACRVESSASVRLANLKIEFTRAVKMVGLDRTVLDRGLI